VTAQSRCAPDSSRPALIFMVAMQAAFFLAVVSNLIITPTAVIEGRGLNPDGAFLLESLADRSYPPHHLDSLCLHLTANAVAASDTKGWPSLTQRLLSRAKPYDYVLVSRRSRISYHLAVNNNLSLLPLPIFPNEGSVAWR
jgi:hypothetical protein